VIWIFGILAGCIESAWTLGYMRRVKPLDTWATVIEANA
jgi:hypothetical protein